MKVIQIAVASGELFALDSEGGIHRLVGEVPTGGGVEALRWETLPPVFQYAKIAISTENGVPCSEAQETSTDA